MSHLRTPRELFSAFQECAISRDAAAFGALFTEDATMELPFTPGGERLRFDGRDAIERRASEAWGRSPLLPESLTVLATTEGEPHVLVAEYEVRGTNRATGCAFAANALMVLREEEGRIVSMREYLDSPFFAALDA